MRKLLLLISLFTILSCNSTKGVDYKTYEIEMVLENGQTITETYSLPKNVSIYTHSRRNQKWLVWVLKDVNDGYPMILQNRVVSYKIL